MQEAARVGCSAAPQHVCRCFIELQVTQNCVVSHRVNRHLQAGDAADSDFILQKVTVKDFLYYSIIYVKRTFTKLLLKLLNTI